MHKSRRTPRGEARAEGSPCLFVYVQVCVSVCACVFSVCVCVLLLRVHVLGGFVIRGSGYVLGVLLRVHVPLAWATVCCWWFFNVHQLFVFHERFLHCRRWGDV